MQPLTDEERARALAAIRQAHPTAEVLQRGPADCWAVDEGAERVIYLADRPAGLPAGHSYTTWMVAFHQGAVVRVSRFASTACDATGR